MKRPPKEGASGGGDRHALTGAAIEACRDFLKSLGQTVKLFTLYTAQHPVSEASLQASGVALRRVLSEAGAEEAALSVVEGRWMLNGTVIVDSRQGPENLFDAFLGYRIHSVAFSGAARPYELSALCELLATSAHRVSQTEAAAFLRLRGVHHIRVNAERYSRRRQAAGLPKVESPIGPQPPEEAPRSGLERLSGLSFGSFIKTLVDESISDPVERATIYAEVLRAVKQSLERRVAEATEGLSIENRRVLNERIRTELVLATMAEGRVVVDKDGRVLMMDPRAEEISGRRLIELAGKPILENLKDPEHVVALAADIAFPQGEELEGEVRVAGDQGALSALRQSMAVVEDEQGRIVGTYGVVPSSAKYREALRQKDEFLAQVTHELKAPLSAICSALEILSENVAEALKDADRRFLDISLKNAQQLRHMISETLDFSRMQSGRMTVQPAAIPVDPILHEAVESLKPWAALKKIALGLDASAEVEDDIWVFADHNRMVQVLTNLVSNAIKSTPEGGSIWVSAVFGRGEQEGQAVFSVRDTGCGIAPEDQKRIFERFTQVVAPGRRREGAGLGLTIVRDLVSRHKGTLWLESQPQRGSTFYFTLPLTAKSRAGRAARWVQTAST